MLGAIVWYLGVLIVAILVVFALDVVRQLWVYRNAPPPRVTWPFVGDLLSFIIDPLNWQSARLRKYGGRARSMMWGQNVWITGVPDDLKRCFAAEEKELLGWAPDFIHDLEGKALTMITGPKHTVVRKHLFRLFTTKALAAYFPAMHSFVLREVQGLAEQTAGGTSAPVAMEPVLRHMSFAVVYGSMIDMDKALDTTPIHLYETWLKGFSSIPLYLPFGGLRKGMQAREVLKKHVAELLDDARRKIAGEQTQHTVEDSGIVSEMLLHMQRELQEQGGEDGVLLSDADLIDNLLIFLVAGHETVLSGMCTMMKLLAEHPNVLEKVRAEVMSVCPNIDEPLTFEQVNALSYTAAVVKETLRIMPPVGIGVKEVVVPFQLGPWTIPKGDSIFLMYQEAHKRAYTSPEEFVPERFHNKSAEYASTYSADNRKAYFTFGGGIRSCIGMKFALIEMEMVLAELMRHKLAWKLAPDQNLTPTLEGISIKYIGGVQVVFSSVA